MTKVYLKVIGILALLVYVFGFVGPGAISADNTFFVLVGVAIILAAIPAAIYLGKSAYCDLQRERRMAQTRREIERKVDEELRNL